MNLKGARIAGIKLNYLLGVALLIAIPTGTPDDALIPFLIGVLTPIGYLLLLAGLVAGLVVTS